MTRKFFKTNKITTEEPVSAGRRALLLGASATGVAGAVAGVLARRQLMLFLRKA